MRVDSNDFLTVAKGFLMGAADIVPGVSGGTVALIVGVYSRLLTAISRFDRRLLAMVFAGRWRAAAEHGDLRFMAALGIGIGAGAFSLAGLMRHLLDNHLSLTLAAFFGLILASGLLVGRMCRPGSRAGALQAATLGIAAAAVAVGVVSQTSLGGGSGLGYTFVCGAVAICAMILPGVSGSYLLLLLGMYEPVLDLVHRLKRGAVDGADLLMLAVFAAGCLVGLAAFSRVLRWLLSRHEAPTMAALCGFMIGSLYKIWPFQSLPRESAEGLGFKERFARMEPVWPDALDSETMSCLAVAIGAAAFVLIADAVARRAGARGRLESAGKDEAVNR